jgi:drug/metabolite transporter (DMT)-like permease
MTRRNTLLGIAAMCAAMLGFVTNDAQVKLASEGLPLGEIIFLRGVFSTFLAVVLVFATRQTANWRLLRHPAMFLRGFGDVVATMLFLTAVINLPLANATIVLQTVPLAVTAAGAFFLREHVGWRRWTAVAIGLIGVMVVIRPGLAGFSPYSLLALGAVLFITLRDLATNRLPAGLPDLLVVAASLAAVMAAGAVLGLSEDWVWPSALQLTYIAGAGICLIAAHWSIIVALRSAPVSVTAPFGYTNVIWAVLFGLMIWGDRLEAVTMIGAGLVVGSGVYALYRERKAARGELGRERSIGGSGV